MRQIEMGARSLFAGAAAAALLWSLVFIGIGTAVARAATLPVDVGGWTPAAAGISMAPEAKNNSSYGGTRVETTAHAGFIGARHRRRCTVAASAMYVDSSARAVSASISYLYRPACIRECFGSCRSSFGEGDTPVVLVSNLTSTRTNHRCNEAEDLINNAQVQAIVAPQKSVVKAVKFSQFGNLMSIWMEETYLGIHGGLNSSGTGTMELEPVFWQEDPVMTSKGSDKILDPEPSLNSESKSTNARKLLVERNLGKVCSDNTTKPLRIGVPLKHGFENFVKVSDPCSYCNGTNICSSTKKQNITGYSIDVFEDAMKELQDTPRYEYCIFDGSYDDLVGNVSSGNLDGAAGDVTITSDRINTVDFTMPYTQSGVALLVHRDRSDPIQWRFLTPLSNELWFATVGFFCFTGFVIWMIERPKNPEYQGSAMGQFSTAAYFAFSTLTFSHGQNVRSPLSRFAVLVLVQSYTASLSSLLTADRLQPSVKDLNQLLKAGDSVGYQKGSFVLSLLRHRNFPAENLTAYSSADEYAKALRNGSKNGGVSAIVDEVPYLKAFLSDSRYEEEFEIQDQIFRTPGFGFVFNSCHCRLVNTLSSAILGITGGEEISTIEKEWLGTSTAAAAADASLTITKADYTPLTLRNFSGLFLFSGLVSSLMLLISMAKLAYATWAGAEDADAVQTAGSTIPGDQQYHPLENTTDNISVLIDHPHPEATNGDHQGGHGSDCSVPEELLNEAISHERGHSANAVHDGSAPAQSLKMIEMNIV